MELRDVRRRKRRLHLVAISLLCVFLGAILFSNIIILFASDVIANTPPARIDIDPVLLDENDPEIIPDQPSKSQARGTIYLTFDDGPGPFTAALLDTLKNYNVKATFFVTKNGDDALIKREQEEGHAIGLHSYSHSYPAIYTSVDNFFSDLAQVQTRVQNILGSTTMLLRFPGGSSNTVSRKYDKGAHIMSSLVAEVTKRGYIYFDWNIDSDDAGAASTSDAVFANVINRLKDGDNVILQHDVKSYSVEAVERIIRYGLEHNYTFSEITADTKPVHHSVNN